jgi:hypothetical protein
MVNVKRAELGQPTIHMGLVGDHQGEQLGIGDDRMRQLAREHSIEIWDSRLVCGPLAWSSAIAAVGRPQLRVHDLRHTAASMGWAVPVRKSCNGCSAMPQPP